MLRPRVDGTTITFTAPASPTLEQRIRNLGGQRQNGVCRVPLYRILDFEDSLGLPGIEKDDAYLAARLKTLFGVTQQEQVERATLLHQEPGPLQRPGLRVPLYPYQARAVRFLERAGSGILGDEPGLGKTLQAIAWAHGRGPTLVVCPAGVAGVWDAEVRTKSDATVGVIRGGRGQPIPATDFVVISYSILEAHRETLARHGFQSMVVDEAHYIKDPKSQRSKAASRLAASIPRKLFLSGSLLLRGTEDIYPIVRLLRPDDFPSFAAFRDRYCKVQNIRKNRRPVQAVVGSKNVDELRIRLEPWMASRRLAEVIADLPELREQVVELQLSAAQLARYRTCIQRLRTTHHTPGAGLDAFRDAVHVVQEAKTAAAAEIMEDLRPSDRKMLVFSHHLSPLNDLDTKPWHEVSVRLTGGVPAAQRTQLVARFQAEPILRAALCQLEAAGTGITLDAADTVLMVDPGWTPALIDQAIGRARRVTTKHPVLVYHFLVKGTLDEVRWDRLRERREALAGLHGGPSDATSIERDVYNALAVGSEELTAV